MKFKTPRSKACDLNWVTESENMQLYLYVYKCSCKQWYVTLVFMTQSLKIVLKIKHKLYVASESVPPANMKNSGCAPGSDYTMLMIIE